MAALHKRITELRQTCGPNRPQPQVAGEDLPSSLFPKSSPSTLSTPSLPDSKAPSFTSSEASDQRPNTRGRPRIELNASAQRGLIRLYVCTSKPLRSIEEAIVRSGGPGRLWLRKFFGRVTGAGKGSDTRLEELRLKDGELNREREEEVSRAHQSETRQRTDEDVVSLRHGDGRVTPATIRLAASEKHTALDGQFEETQVLKSPFDKAHFDSGREILPQSSLPRTNRNPRQVHPEASPMPSHSSKRVQTQKNCAIGDLSLEQNPETAKQLLTPVHKHCLPTGSTLRFRDSVAINGDLNKRHLQQGKVSVVKAEDPSKTRVYRCKRKRRETSFSLSSAARHLDGGTPDACYHLAKCSSISKPTVASRVSWTLSPRKMRTALSEFKQYYNRPRPDEINQNPLRFYQQAAARLGGQNTQEPIVEALAVAILIDARTLGLSDEEVESNLTRVLPIKQHEREAFVNAADKRGVSPLHLAVAYGYTGTCALLLRNGANIHALTAKGTNVYNFARPAARLAGERMTLYFRILHCRTWVKHGQQPPAPRRIPTDRRNGADKQATNRRERSVNNAASGIASKSGLARTPLHIEGSGSSTTSLMVPSRPTTMETLTVGTERNIAVDLASFASLEDDIPRYTNRLTDSPTATSYHRNNSLPMSDNNHFNFLNWIHRNAPISNMQMSARQTDPGLSYSGPAVPAATAHPVIYPSFTELHTQARLTTTAPLSLQTTHYSPFDLEFENAANTGGVQQQRSIPDFAPPAAYNNTLVELIPASLAHQSMGHIDAHNSIEEIYTLPESNQRHEHLQHLNHFQPVTGQVTIDRTPGFNRPSEFDCVESLPLDDFDSAMFDYCCHGWQRNY